MLLKNAMDFRTNRIGRIFLLNKVRHRNDAARVYRMVGNPDFSWNAMVVIAHEITRIIVGD